MRIRRIIISITTLGLILLSPSLALAQVNDLVIPPPSGYVNDFANWLSPATASLLEQQLSAFEQETGHEIVVATTESLQETYIEDLATRWFESWGIGKAQADNGILFLIVPSAREMRIEVGYGLEGILPDTLASRILETAVKPEFQADNPEAGVIAGVDLLTSITSGEEVPEYLLNPNANVNSQIGLFVFGFIIFLVAFAIYNGVAGNKKRQKTMRKPGPRLAFVGIMSLISGGLASLSGFAPWIAWFVIYAVTAGSLFYYLLRNAGKNAGRSGGSSGFWSSGGYSSGGGSSFGGFGGGSSGGGGASSSW